MMKPNAQGNTVKAPPLAIENIVRLLTPRIRRRDIVDELREDFERKPDSSRYIRNSARTLAQLISGTALSAFNAALVMAQAGVLVLSFAGASVSLALAFGIGIGLLVLAFRDGHTFPSEEPLDAIVDSAVAVTLVILSVILVSLMAKVPILPFNIMVRGGIASLLSLSLLRMIFRRPDYNRQYSPRDLAVQWYLMACRVNVIWAVAYGLFSITNADSNYHWADKFFGFAPWYIIGMNFKVRLKSFNRPSKDDAAKSIRADHDKMELDRKLSLLWTPKTIITEVAFFSIVAMQCVVAIYASPTMDWIRLGTNVTASFMLMVVWRYIRKANFKAAELIQAEIGKLEAAK